MKGDFMKRRGSVGTLAPTSGLKIKGFFRVQIVDKKTRKVVGDSGLLENQITNYGMANCFLACPAKLSGSLQIDGARLGSGTNPASTAVVLDGSHTAYYSTLGTGLNGSTQVQFTQSYDGTLGAVTIANVGLYATNTGSLIAGKTYGSSAVATTQDVNLTYYLNYSTS